MSSIWDIPENIQFPADYKSPPSFNHLVLVDAYFRECERNEGKPAERGALQLGFDSYFFLLQSLPPPGSDYVAALEGTPTQTRVLHWKSRQEALVNYLHPYQMEVRNHGAPEQVEFVRTLLDMKLHEYIRSKSPTAENEPPQTSREETNGSEDHEPEVEMEVIPEPAEAITILERIAQGHPSTSVEYVALQITIRALQYLIENGEAPEFMRYVDQMSKWVPPPDDA